MVREHKITFHSLWLRTRGQKNGKFPRANRSLCKIVPRQNQTLVIWWEELPNFVLRLQYFLNLLKAKIGFPIKIVKIGFGFQENLFIFFLLQINLATKETFICNSF